MKPTTLVAPLLASLTLCTALSAQPRFEVPLWVTDGNDADTLHFGIFPGAHLCMVFPPDSINGHEEYELPPIPPTGVFDARMVWPRTGPNPEPPCSFGFGLANDYRPYTSPTQRDTFRVRTQLGLGTAMVVSWPANLNQNFQTLEMRHFDGTSAIITNMLTNTSVDITNENGDPHIGTIYSLGPLVSVDQTSADMPEGFALSQNYPNPFNPTTTLSFSIPLSSFVILKVYNILGQEMRTVVYEMKDAGSHHISFDGADLRSGMYVYRIQSDGHVASRKMILLR